MPPSCPEMIREKTAGGRSATLGVRAVAAGEDSCKEDDAGLEVRGRAGPFSGREPAGRLPCRLITFVSAI